MISRVIVRVTNEHLLNLRSAREFCACSWDRWNIRDTQIATIKSIKLQPWDDTLEKLKGLASRHDEY